MSLDLGCSRPKAVLRSSISDGRGAPAAAEGGSAYPRGAHIEARGKALDAMSASDARGFFEHRGYHAKVHLL